MVLEGMDERGVDAAATQVVGDACFDMEMARAAGVRALGVSFGVEPAERLLAAGAARIRPGIFVFYNFLGTLLKSSVFIAIGYLFGRFYESFSTQFRIAGLLGLGLGMLVLVYLMHRLWTSANSPGGLE